ncbi:GDP-mannose 4,6-dehydratase [bacterium]|nr:GDP-mannose 4,6-dehydratase [bacterium]
MRALITGITGFAGSHLAEYLLSRGDEVWGLCRRRSPRKHLTKVRQQLKLVEGDMRDQSSLFRVLRESQPDTIFHLAAQSFVPTSWRAPADTFETNVTGQSYLFEVVREMEIDPMIQIAGSSEEYGMVYPDETPIGELNPLRPLSPYAVSKVAQDLMAYQYHRSYGMRVVRTRAFNHTGPRRGPEFVASAFARQIVAIEKGAAPIIRVGNLEAERDFTDVRDVVQAYVASVECGEPGEVYNICSGSAVSIGTLLEMLLSLSKIKVTIEKDPALDRPSDVPLLLGDASKFKKASGWERVIPLEKTLLDLLNWWRRR